MIVLKDGPTGSGAKCPCRRCGASSNEPFCNGSHASIEFRDER